MRAFMFILPLILTFSTAAQAVTPEECQTSLDNLLLEIENNRRYAEDIYRINMEAAETESERDVWRAEIDKIYDHEERQRGRADHMWRDCMKATGN